MNKPSWLPDPRCYCANTMLRGGCSRSMWPWNSGRGLGCGRTWSEDWMCVAQPQWNHVRSTWVWHDQRCKAPDAGSQPSSSLAPGSNWHWNTGKNLEEGCVTNVILGLPSHLGLSLFLGPKSGANPGLIRGLHQFVSNLCHFRFSKPGFRFPSMVWHCF